MKNNTVHFKWEMIANYQGYSNSNRSRPAFMDCHLSSIGRRRPAGRGPWPVARGPWRVYVNQSVNAEWRMPPAIYVYINLHVGRQRRKIAWHLHVAISPGDITNIAMEIRIIFVSTGGKHTFYRYLTRSPLSGSCPTCHGTFPHTHTHTHTHKHAHEQTERLRGSGPVILDATHEPI